MLIALAMTGLACDTIGGSSQPQDRTDSLSYSVGQDVGQNIRKNLIDQGVEINPQTLLAGFKDATADDSSQVKLTAEQAQMLNMAFQRMMMEKQMEMQRQQQIGRAHV